MYCVVQMQTFCELLCHFFTEVRKSDGSPYCPRSLSSMSAGVQCYIQTTSPHLHKIMDLKSDFKPLHVLLELHEQGFGAVKAQARVISFEKEAKLLETGAIGVNNPQSLLNAVFHLNGINFTIRGGAEHMSFSVNIW